MRNAHYEECSHTRKMERNKLTIEHIFTNGCGEREKGILFCFVVAHFSLNALSRAMNVRTSPSSLSRNVCWADAWIPSDLAKVSCGTCSNQSEAHAVTCNHTAHRHANTHTHTHTYAFHMHSPRQTLARQPPAQSPIQTPSANVGNEVKKCNEKGVEILFICILLLF